MQVGWNDTKTGQLLLSRQNLTQLAAQPPGKMRVLYKIGTKNPVLNMLMHAIPLTRYTY